jgi:hypothetical protein
MAVVKTGVSFRDANPGDPSDFFSGGPCWTFGGNHFLALVLHQRAQAPRPVVPVTRRESDTSLYVGHNCQVCGKRVLVSATGQGFWAVEPKTRTLKAWHLECKCPS